MEKSFDYSKEYGVVLEGGGAKGAYQIGVWKALLECNVKIKGVAGVSVGALNGALICMGNYEEAEEIWKNISYSTVMNVNDTQMDKLFSHKIKELDIKEITKDTTQILADGGIDITPLKKLIDERVDENKIKQSEIEFVMGTFLVSKLKEVEITAKEAEDGYLKDYLLASSYLPAFQNEKLHGKKYLDGGMFNNVPLDMLIKRGYKDIIIVRIFGIGLEKRINIPKDVNIIQIAPRIDLGGILEFDSMKCSRNIKIGYFDGLRCLHSLLGKIYYIDSKLSEEDCISFFIQVGEAVKMALIEYYKMEYTNFNIYTRKFIEAVCPNLAATLKLSKDWTYHSLYIGLLELGAKSLRIQKYKIYTEEELSFAIKDKYKSMQTEIQFPIFIQLILKMLTI
jgi:NTE family protein